MNLEHLYLNQTLGVTIDQPHDKLRAIWENNKKFNKHPFISVLKALLSPEVWKNLHLFEDLPWRYTPSVDDFMFNRILELGQFRMHYDAKIQQPAEKSNTTGIRETASSFYFSMFFGDNFISLRLNNEHEFNEQENTAKFIWIDRTKPILVESIAKSYMQKYKYAEDELPKTFALLSLAKNVSNDAQEDVQLTLRENYVVKLIHPASMLVSGLDEGNGWMTDFTVSAIYDVPDMHKSKSIESQVPVEESAEEKLKKFENRLRAASVSIEQALAGAVALVSDDKESPRLGLEKYEPATTVGIFHAGPAVITVCSDGSVNKSMDGSVWTTHYQQETGLEVNEDLVRELLKLGVLLGDVTEFVKKSNSPVEVNKVFNGMVEEMFASDPRIQSH